MIHFSQFHFLRPLWLLALVPLLVLVWMLAYKKIGNRGWEAVCDKALIPYILIGETTKLKHWHTWLTGICGLLGILALAGPCWDRLPQPLYTSGSALVIALDLSRSMDATDITPNRLERARFKIEDLLKTRKEGQTSLVVYAEDAYTVTPLTDDIATITSQLDVLSPSLMPVQGSNAGHAVKLAESLLQQAGAGTGHILLVTDDVDPGSDISIARHAGENGYPVSILGVGTEQGAPIKLNDGEYLKDDKGEIVVPKMDGDKLRSVAVAGGGIYQSIRTDDADINTLSEFINAGKIKKEQKSTALKTDTWRDEGPWLVLLLIPLAALSFRRGYLLLLLFLVFPCVKPAYAFEWNDLWLTPDQQGVHALNAGEADKAAGLFSDPAWKAAADYRAGKFDDAAKELKNRDDAESNYNRGNALARQGLYRQAIAAYDKTLKLDPSHKDARYNRDLVRKELEKQKKSKAGNDQKSDKQSPEKANRGGQEKPGQQSAGNGNNDNKNKNGNSSQANNKQKNTGQNNANRQPQASTSGTGHKQTEQSGEQGGQSNKGTKDSDQQQLAGRQDQNVPVTGSSPETGQNNNVNGNRDIATANDAKPDEETQATEQWLRRIPDDPGGLLRRKFLYQYQRQARIPDRNVKQW